MKFKHDVQADAAYIYLNDAPYAYGKDLDTERRIDYASDNTPVGVELLSVSKGVNLDGLPRSDEVAEVLEAKGIKIYVIERRSPVTWQGYSSVVFNVKFASPAAEKVEAPRLKKEVTA